MRKIFHNFLTYFSGNWLAVGLSALGGICTAALAYINYFQLPLFSKRNLLICSLLAVFAALAILFFYNLWFKPLINKISAKKFRFLALLALILSAVFAVVLSFNIRPLYFLYPERSVSISFAMGNQIEGDKGVSLSYLHTDFRDISFSELVIKGEHEIREDRIYFSPNQTVQINWQGITGKSLLAAFESTDFDQPVEIDWDGRVDQLQLFNLKSETITAQQEFSPFRYEELILRLLLVPVFFLVFLMLLLGLFSPIPYTSVMLFVWLMTLLVYWPGIIGNVNLVAVDEWFAGQLADWHPVVYTLILGTMIKIFSTVSAFLLIQITALSLVLGWGFAYFEQLGVKRNILWILTFITAFLPANLLSVITLTNDIAFSITLAALTIMVIKIVFSKGLWLEKTRNWICFILVSLLSIFFRYNGIPAVGLTLLALLVFLPAQRKIIITITGVVILGWVLMNGPIFNLLGVNRVSEGQLDNILLHHISAHVDAGTLLDMDEKQYLDSLFPLEAWDYSCCTNKAMWAKPEFDAQRFHDNSAINKKIAVDLFLKAPLVGVKHILCAGDLVWNIPGQCAIEHPYISENNGRYAWTRSYYPLYKEDSMLPFKVKPLSDLLNLVEENVFLSTLVWRPAIYLYLSILAVLVFYFKTRIGRVFLVLAPIFGQSAFLFLFNRTQNFRYQYCAILIALVLVGLFCMPLKPSKEN
jgi:hypothetical protein